MKTAAMKTVAALALGVSAWTAMAQETGEPGRGPVSRPMGPMGSPIVTALDANGDGTIDADEMASASKSLRKLDANQDGKLTQDEVRPQGRGVGGAGGPGAAGPGGPGFGGPGRGGMRTAGEPSPFAAKTIPKTDEEKKVLAVLDEMDRNQRRGSLSVPTDDGRFLRVMTETIGAKHVVELGTSIGYSGIWFCLGLKSTGGKLTTFEIDPDKVATARSNFKKAGVDHIATVVEGDAHENVSKVEGPVDLVFLDADKEGYIDYLNKLLPKLRSGGLVIAHNISQRQADPKYIEAITTSLELETVFVNLGSSGISVSLKKR